MVSYMNSHLGALRRPCAGSVGAGVVVVSRRGVAASGAVARWAALPAFSRRQETQVKTAPPVVTIDGTSLSAPPERSP